MCYPPTLLFIVLPQENRKSYETLEAIKVQSLSPSMSGVIMGQANILADDHPEMACFGLLYNL